jgi:hypothetical protein
MLQHYLQQIVQVPRSANNVNANICTLGNTNVVNQPYTAGGTSSTQKPTPSFQALNSRVQRLHNRLSTPISSFPGLSKPSRHRKTVSDIVWSDHSRASEQDTMKSHEINPEMEFQHPTTALGNDANENMGIQASHGLNQQRVNHGHSRSNDDRSRLGDQLYAVLQDDATTNGRRFVTRVDLDRIITQETVQRELSRVVYFLASISPKVWRTRTTSRLPIGSSSGHADARHLPAEENPSKGPDNKSVQQIFAILLLIDRPTKIWSFVREGICDADLPLEVVLQDTSPRLRSARNPRVHLKCLKKSRDISGFVEKQWIVHVPVFEQSSTQEIPHIQADDRQSLSFVQWKSSGRSGRFGEIYQAKIHHHHCKFSQDVVSNGRMFEDAVS